MQEACLDSIPHALLILDKASNEVLFTNHLAPEISMPFFYRGNQGYSLNQLVSNPPDQSEVFTNGDQSFQLIIKDIGDQVVIQVLVVPRQDRLKAAESVIETLKRKIQDKTLSPLK